MFGVNPTVCDKLWGEREIGEEKAERGKETAIERQ